MTTSNTASKAVASGHQYGSDSVNYRTIQENNGGY